MSDGKIFVFCSRGNDLNQSPDLGLVVQTHAEQLDGGVVDVVVGGDHAQVQGGRVHVVLDADALAVLQLPQRALHHLGQVVGQVSVGDALHVVVVGVLGHSSVQECPGQIVNSILFVLNSFSHNLCIEMIMETVIKMGFYG